jgi:hypothetical protein
MSSVIIGGMLFGALLGRYFRVLVLAPAILIAVAAVTLIGIANGEGARAVSLTVLSVAASLQAAYIAGCILRAMVSAPSLGRAWPIRRPVSPNERAAL